LDTNNDCLIVRKIKIQRAIISAKAAEGLCQPKNIIDQNKLSVNWIKNNFIALTFSFFFEIHKRYREIPIRIYKVVQVGPKIQFGGLKKGLFKVAYQVGIAETVKTEPKPPMARGRTIETTNLSGFNLTLKLYHKKPQKIKPFRKQHP